MHVPRDENQQLANHVRLPVFLIIIAMRCTMGPVEMVLFSVIATNQTVDTIVQWVCTRFKYV